MKPSAMHPTRPDHPGLCATCTHAHEIVTTRSTAYWRCRLADVDPTFPRYPPLPVLACTGFAAADVSVEDQEGPPADRRAF